MNTELLTKTRCESVFEGGNSYKALYAKVEGDIIQIERGCAKLGKKLKVDNVIYAQHVKTYSDGVYTIDFKSKLRPEKLKDVADIFIFAGMSMVFMLPEKHQLKILAAPDNNVVMNAVNGLSKSLGPSAEFQAAIIRYVTLNDYNKIIEAKELKGTWETTELFVPQMPNLS